MNLHMTIQENYVIVDNKQCDAFEVLQWVKKIVHTTFLIITMSKGAVTTLLIFVLYILSRVRKKWLG